MLFRSLAFVYAVGLIAVVLVQPLFGHYLGLAGAIVFAVAAFFMWRGLEVGRWLAALALIELLTVIFFGAGAAMLSEFVAVILGLAVAGLIVAAIMVVLFAESVSDLLARQFDKRAREVEWPATPTESVSSAPQRSHSQVTDPERVRDVVARASRRKRLGHVLAGGIIGIQVIGVVLFILILVTVSSEVRPEALQLHQEIAAAQRNFDALKEIYLELVLVFGGIILVAAVIVAYFAVFLAPFILGLPVIAPFVLGWHEPARFLLLRPFNRQKLTHPLVQFIKESVAGFGHVYTLADTTLRVPMYVRIPIVLGQVA